ncbi:MAG: hypothetical protein AAGF36_11830 [Pseudomonadota bacterium]
MDFPPAKWRAKFSKAGAALCGGFLLLSFLNTRLAGMQEISGALRLMTPELCEVFCKEYVEHLNRLRRSHNASLKAMQKEHDQAMKQLREMVDAIVECAPVAPIKDRMHELENRRVEIRAILEEAQPAPVLFHPNIADRYHRAVQNLIAALNESDHRAEAAEIVRSLIYKIVLPPPINRKSV